VATTEESFHDEITDTHFLELFDPGHVVIANKAHKPVTAAAATPRATAVAPPTAAAVAAAAAAAAADEAAAELERVIGARRSADRAGLLRVVSSKAMDFFAPLAKRALGSCLLQLLPAVDPCTATQTGNNNISIAKKQWTISVEAAGSGLVLVPALQVDQWQYTTTVGDLKALVEQRCGVPAGSIRLFLGHGGKELGVDLQRVRAAGVADGATLVLAQISPDFAREALLRLYEATRGREEDNWGWRWAQPSTAPLSECHGVGCNRSGGVVTLSLSNSGLRGMCVRACVRRAGGRAGVHRAACVRGRHSLLLINRQLGGEGEREFHTATVCRKIIRACLRGHRCHPDRDRAARPVENAGPERESAARFVRVG
jgi:hypothetical protein